MSFKAIKPKRLTGDRADRAMSKVKGAIKSEFVPVVLSDMYDDVADWKHQPTFKASFSGGGLTVDFVPVGNKAGKIYGYVSGGTPPHKIRARRARYLVFTGKGAKTRAQGGQRGRKVRVGQTVFARSVNHPGIKARNFVGRRKVRYGRLFKGVVDAAFAEGAA